MNKQALITIYNHLQSMEPKAREALETIEASNVLPAEVKHFATEMDAAISLFQSLDPLVQDLSKLLPDPPAPVAPPVVEAA